MSEPTAARRRSFAAFLQWASAEVAKWPAWKRNVLGGPTVTDQPALVPHPDYPVVLCLSQQERAMLYAMLEDKLARVEAENQWCRRLMAEIEGSMKGCGP